MSGNGYKRAAGADAGKPHAENWLGGFQATADPQDPADQGETSNVQIRQILFQIDESLQARRWNKIIVKT